LEKQNQKNFYPLFARKHLVLFNKNRGASEPVKFFCFFFCKKRMNFLAMLCESDPPPVVVLNAAGQSPFLLVCDHAGRAVPGSLGNMGVSDADWQRHIAWDIGALGLCERLAPLLDAMCITQVYSRLVIDCNRTPGHPTSIAPRSDGTEIVANQGLSAADKQARVDAIFTPYHQAIAAEIDRRVARSQQVVLISMHSFTPVMAGFARPWKVGLLYNRDARLARACAGILTDAGYLVGDNEPYQLSDDSDYSVPVHAEQRGLPYVELEIRQDEIAGADGQAAWAALLARVLREAVTAVMA